MNKISIVMFGVLLSGSALAVSVQPIGTASSSPAFMTHSISSSTSPASYWPHHHYYPHYHHWYPAPPPPHHWHHHGWFWWWYFGPNVTIMPAPSYPTSTCVSNYWGGTACGYNCVQTATQVACAPSPTQNCVANSLGQIRCGNNCFVDQYNNIICG